MSYSVTGPRKMVKTCQKCYGFGLWAVGDPVPMGPIDAMDGLPTLPCPECGANANPVEELLMRASKK